MIRLARVLVLLLFPLLLAARGLNALFGRDPLRLRPSKQVGYWIERSPSPGLRSYFSEASESEGRNHGGFGRIAVASLRAVAVLFAPRRDRGAKAFKSATDRGQDIPDEIYTLW